MMTPNGTATLQATTNWAKATMPPMSGTAVSQAVSCTVRNGFRVISDPTKTYAKVLSPTPGQIIIAPAAFTVSSDHQITWERYDSCRMYSQEYKWQQVTSWKLITDKVMGPANYTLPMAIGEWSLHSPPFANTYPSGLPKGAFTAEAFSYTPSSTTVGHGVSAFVMQ
jgi:hypothetical protein